LPFGRAIIRFSSHKFARFDLIHVTPNPGLPRFNGTNQRVLGFVEMLGGVLVLGRIATTDVPANQA
jgi:hypothetical protein